MTDPFKTLIIGYSVQDLSKIHSGIELDQYLANRISYEKADTVLQIMQNKNFSAYKIIGSDDPNIEPTGAFELHFHDEQTYLEFQFLL